MDTRFSVYTPLPQLVNEDLFANAEKIEDNIWVIHDFLPQEILKKYQDYIKSIPEEEWWKSNKNWWIGKYYVVEDLEMQAVEEDVRNMLRPYLKDDLILGALGSIHRLKVGDGMFVHTDNPASKRDILDEEGNKIATTNGHNNYCVLAMIIYLTDFNGGQLFFPELGVEWQPKANDIVFFPGVDERYDHGVRRVLEGEHRYVVTGFGYDIRGAELKSSNYVFEGEDGYNTLEPKYVQNDPQVEMEKAKQPRCAFCGSGDRARKPNSESRSPREWMNFVCKRCEIQMKGNI